MLTTFKSSIIFEGSWGSIENWLEPKTEPPSGTVTFVVLQKFKFILGFKKYDNLF